LLQAYKLVKDKGFAVKKAARIYGVPQQTLRDRVLGRIDPINFGNETLFSKEEERKLVEHLQARADLGYGLTNVFTQRLAGEMAFELGKKAKNTPMSNKWLYAFLKRWKNDIASLKPRQLETSRAKSSTPEIIKTYFSNLRAVIEQNALITKPQHIYNLDETGIQPEHKPSNVIADPNHKPQAITSPKSTTTTVIGCANALGNSIPPFFVFKGKRWNPDLMKGACTGADGTMSETGWSNGEIFRHYLEHHFLPYARPSPASNQPILLIYDGHSSHKSPETIKWAREHGIILFVLPAHSSHLLQPLDVAIFGPFKKHYYSECAQFLSRHMGQNITKYNICALACRAYLKALTPANIQSGFRKTGIYPLKTDVIKAEQLLPCESFREKEPVKKVKMIKAGPEAVEKFLNEKEEQILKMVEQKNTGCQCSCKKKRVSEKPNASGKAITDDNFFSDMTIYLEQKKKTSSPKKPTKKAKSSKNIPMSPKPSTSGLQKKIEGPGIPVDSDSDSSMSDSDADKCCVCGKSTPPRLHDYIKIIGWASCDSCGHWVHLTYCTTEHVVRRHTQFLCPHCKQN
jgi:hypothetical protein